MKSISIFGFTGSIGSQALDIIENHQEAFEIDVLVCNENIDKAISLINIHKPKNEELIKIREKLQSKIDDWHIQNKGKEIDIVEYKKFLKKIDYLKDEGPDFKIETKNVDEKY